MNAASDEHGFGGQSSGEHGYRQTRPD